MSFSEAALLRKRKRESTSSMMTGKTSMLIIFTFTPANTISALTNSPTLTRTNIPPNTFEYSNNRIVRRSYA